MFAKGSFNLQSCRDDAALHKNPRLFLDFKLRWKNTSPKRLPHLDFWPGRLLRLVAPDTRYCDAVGNSRREGQFDKMAILQNRLKMEPGQTTTWMTRHRKSAIYSSCHDWVKMISRDCINQQQRIDSTTSNNENRMNDRSEDRTGKECCGAMNLGTYFCNFEISPFAKSLGPFLGSHRATMGRFLWSMVLFAYQVPGMPGTR